MRFYVPKDRWAADATEISLDPGESHHVASVLRATVGDCVDIIDGQGRTATGEITSLHKKETRLRLGPIRILPPPPARLVLAVAIPKGSTMDWIIEKAVELGATEIVPLVTQRTVVRLIPSVRPERQRKWQRIAVEACKQCGQPWLPWVRTPRTLSEALLIVPPPSFARPLLASLEPPVRPLSSLWPPSAPASTPTPEAASTVTQQMIFEAEAAAAAEAKERARAAAKKAWLASGGSGAGVDGAAEAVQAAAEVAEEAAEA